jgi:hypothetical protein
MDKKKQTSNLPFNQPTHFPKGKVQISFYSWFIYQDQYLFATYALLIGLGRELPLCISPKDHGVYPITNTCTNNRFTI